jgi:hypothetical protein
MYNKYSRLTEIHRQQPPIATSCLCVRLAIHVSSWRVARSSCFWPSAGSCCVALCPELSHSFYFILSSYFDPKLCPDLNLNSVKSFNQKCCQTIGLQSIDLNFWRLSNGFVNWGPQQQSSCNQPGRIEWQQPIQFHQLIPWNSDIIPTWSFN